MTDFATGHRVTLRNLTAADLAAFQAYRGDPGVARYQGWTAMTDDQARAFLLAMSGVPLLTRGDWTQIAIADVEGQLIGDMGLHQSDDGASVELGITLARAAQGRGLATEAMRLAIALVWDHPEVTTIRTWADRRNIASVALCHRVGLTHLGVETTGDVEEEAFILHRPAAR